MKKCFLTAVVLMIFIVIPVAGSAMEYKHTLEVKDMTFSWTIEGDQIHVKLSAKTTGWVGIGFDPENAMEGGDIVIGAVKGDKFKVEDHYGDRKRGHKNDEKLGGKNDVLNAAGSEADGVTTISFTKSLKAADKYDKDIVPDSLYRVMLAYGSGKDSFKTRHPYRTVYDINLTTGESKKIK